MNTLTQVQGVGLATLASAFCYIYASDLLAAEPNNTAQSTLKLRPKVPIHQRMDFIQDRGQLLMIPKKALIYVPDSLQNKVITNGETDGKLVRLDQFMAQNSNWLITHPVSFDLALGKTQFTPEMLEHLQSLNKIVIATHGNKPIGVSAKAWLSEVTENNEEL
ncbi:hypothetical protein [Rubritalea marina]|uniref:hypothetical protein n=1 Tax=Rubritalea marina TaxID=361055 RepID=UPI000380F084|nr:hypothetical protein [Rubritalea marina]